LHRPACARKTRRRGALRARTISRWGSHSGGETKNYPMKVGVTKQPHDSVLSVATYLYLQNNHRRENLSSPPPLLLPHCQLLCRASRENTEKEVRLWHEEEGPGISLRGPWRKPFRVKLQSCYFRKYLSISWGHLSRPFSTFSRKFFLTGGARSRTRINGSQSHISELLVQNADFWFKRLCTKITSAYKKKWFVQD
jgi:hypothetical protein